MTRCVGLYEVAAVPNGEVHFPNAGTQVALLLVEDQQWRTASGELQLTGTTVSGPLIFLWWDSLWLVARGGLHGCVEEYDI